MRKEFFVRDNKGVKRPSVVFDSGATRSFVRKSKKLLKRF